LPPPGFATTGLVPVERAINRLNRLTALFLYSFCPRAGRKKDETAAKK
jgi:hypothetical protein